MTALLVEGDISRDLVRQLIAQGFVAVHWLDIGRKGAHDALIFSAAQQQHLAVFTWNRDDYVFAATCWRNWGLGDHWGVIAPRQGKYHSRLPPPLLYPILILARFGADTSSFLNRIELF